MKIHYVSTCSALMLGHVLFRSGSDTKIRLVEAWLNLRFSKIGGGGLHRRGGNRRGEKVWFIHPNKH